MRKYKKEIQKTTERNLFLFEVSSIFFFFNEKHIVVYYLPPIYPNHNYNVTTHHIHLSKCLIKTRDQIEEKNFYVVREDWMDV